MSQDDDLVPLKRVLEAVGVSRATLYRAAHSGIEGFPQPTKRRGRLYWRAGEISAIEHGLDEYEGRGVFDQKKRNERQRLKTRHEALSELKLSKRGRRKRDSVRKKPSQGDLFGT